MRCSNSAMLSMKNDNGNCKDCAGVCVHVNRVLLYKVLHGVHQLGRLLLWLRVFESQASGCRTSIGHSCHTSWQTECFMSRRKMSCWQTSGHHLWATATMAVCINDLHGCCHCVKHVLHRALNYAAQSKHYALHPSLLHAAAQQWWKQGLVANQTVSRVKCRLYMQYVPLSCM